MTIVAEAGLADLRALLEAVVQAGASDLHLRSDEQPRMRVQGALVGIGPVVTADEVSAMMGSAMSDDVRATYAAVMEADFAVHLPGVGRFRVNAFRTQGRDACVLRRITDEPLSLDALDMPPVVRKLAMQTRGLVLVTGPTGSGKTTTLSAMIDAINDERAVHVLTLEDPIEVVHRSRTATVTQRELGSDSHTWSGALRAAMRQDPDVILIGEMRDAETVHAALSAAETGHLVLSTLHTTDALETVQRILAFFPPHEQPRVRAALASSLQGIVCQRLVPRLYGRGRVCVLEVAVADARFSDAIADPDRTNEIPDILADGGYSGMQSFDQHLVRLVIDGLIDLRTARGAASNAHDLTVALRRTGWKPGAIEGETP
ncbi:type IV pilus twitching motility protein PilT [Nocardioides dongkuii]|uniref:type IV pilus twitching motility protein PilT n=1 Tax=Nocardioides dongkuii TaxID=2760089 RepID=UPI001FCF96F3|nr:PilT/PilU family type 4a pilus ATPase [Nocardioides dongkuii]